jgi:hypothetical protein
VAEAKIIGVRQESLAISGRPNCAQSAVSVLFAKGRGKVDLIRVAVKPKLPAVPVEAERITELIPLM